VPLRVVVCGEPAALSATDRVAEKPATEPGEKVTEIAQLAPAARELPQLLVWAKSLVSDPVRVMPVIASAALPALVRVAVCAALVVPETALNVKDMGVSEATGAGAAEKFAVTLRAADIVTVVEALEALATLPVQLVNTNPELGVAARFTTDPDA